MQPMNRTSPAFLFALVLLAACGKPGGEQIDPASVRRYSPEGALNAARAALHRRDLPAYFDALTDSAVRQTLKNSIALCSFHAASRECTIILKKYGWREPQGSSPAETNAAWDRALRQLEQPREMAAELEAYHRAAGTGSSFVWEYLDDVTLTDVSVQGNTATALASWSGEQKPVAFERDATGWRFAPFPELSDGGVPG
jgi:hypothetical protein